MLDVDEVAELLNCSSRHVYRQVDGGKMPAPAKIGGINRWPVKTIEDWIAAGCPAVRKIGRG
jgi:excisionase family DNA binding protein